MTEIILKCKTCRWWDRYTEQSQSADRPSLGACRRFPEGKDVVMKETEFCGEHSGIPDPTAEAIMDLTAVLRELLEENNVEVEFIPDFEPNGRTNNE